MRYIIIVMLFIVCPYGLSGQVVFQEVSEAVNFNFTNSVEFGSGVSFCDFDNDGWDDITVGGDEGDEIIFYKNFEGTFDPIFMNIQHPFVPIKQLVWIDFNNDGLKDLFIASELGTNFLYFNVENNLVDITAEAGLPTDNLQTNSGSWGDYDNDGDLDLFLANRDLEEIIPNMLYRNNGDGTFTNVNEASGIGDVSALSFQGTFFDYDNDGWLDIFLINDRLVTENILYKNNGDGTFVDVSQEANANYVMNAMSIALDDYNSDGFIDMYVTNTFNPELPVVGNSLMHNDGDGTFTDLGVEANVSFDSTSWGASFIDGDNDGRLDLYVSGSNDNNNGSNVSAAFYYQNEDESFTRIFDNGFETDLAHSFGNATGDFNNDGLTDIVVSNNSPYTFDLWQNQTDEVSNNNYLKINLEGVQSNRDGYGSRIEININGEKQYRVTANTESYLSQNSDTEIFGLGTAQQVDYIKITWLSGQVDTYENVNANQLVTAIEGQELLSVGNLYSTVSNISIFPNPITNEFAIQGIQDGVASEVTLFDLLGRKLQSWTDISINEAIDISILNPGTYIIQIQSASKQPSYHKIIKR